MRRLLGPVSISSRRQGYLIAAFIAVVGLVILYVLNLFYLQLILVVGSAAAMVGIVVWERRGAGNEVSGSGEGGAAKAQLVKELDLVDEKLVASQDEQERGYFRIRKVQIEQEVRRLEWSEKEAGLDRSQVSQPGPLRPLAPREKTAETPWDAKDEEKHLKDLLAGVSKALDKEAPGSVRAELDLAAHDLRAHYGLIRKRRSGSQNLRDYFASWAVMTAIRNGQIPEIQLENYASRDVRVKLEGLVRIAVSRNVILGS